MNMEQGKSRLLVNKLWFVWWISLFSIGILINIHAAFTYVTTGTSPYQMLSGHQLFSVGITISYFFPLMLVINTLARRNKMQKIIKRSCVLITFLSIWIIFALIAIIAAVIR